MATARQQAMAAKHEAFLEALRGNGNVTAAAKAAKLERTELYRHRLRNPDFAAKWDEAYTLGSAALEDEAVRRASQGVDEPVFYQGAECGSVRKFSDTLLIFLLKARFPDKYRERTQTELVGKDGAPVAPVLNVIVSGNGS